VSGPYLDAALAYVAGDSPIGEAVAVLPVNVHDKRPCGNERWGRGRAPRTPEQVREWWARYPEGRVAVILNPSRLVVLDVEGRNKGFDPDEVLDAVEDAFGSLPPTLSASTSGGGRHYWFRVPEGVSLDALPQHPQGHDAGFEFRKASESKDGHYVAVPSLMDGGELDGRAWLDLAEVAELPPSFYPPPGTTGHTPKPPVTDEQIGEGGRHAYLVRVGGALRRQGCGVEEVEAALLAANRSRCNPPKPEQVVRSLARDLVERYAPAEEEPGGGSSWPSPMRSEAFHGIAGEFVRAVETETEADPAALLLTFLAAAGSAIGAGPFVEVSGDRHPAKLWPVMVGETASGRKGTSLSWPRQVVEQADPSWAQRHAGNVGSGEVLVWAVRDKATKVNDEGHEVVTDAGVDDKRLFVIESEFSSVLRVSKRQGSVLSQVIRSAWDSDRLIHTAKQSPARCMSGAHVVVLGHITAEELRREMTAMDASNGLLNRFMFVAVRRARHLPRGGQLAPGTLERFGERLGVFLDYARTRRRVERSPSFWTVWDPWYMREQHGSGLVAKVLGRAEPYVLRLALLFALLDGEDVITAAHARAALAVWEYVEASARFVFGQASGDPVADRLLGELRSAPEGLTRTAIRDLFSRHSTAQVDRALEELRESGAVVVEKVSTGGRPSEVWSATKATKATKAPGDDLLSLRSLRSQPDARLVGGFLAALEDGDLPPDADVSRYDELTRLAWSEAVRRYTAGEEVPS
jgi:hypothetical protein